MPAGIDPRTSDADRLGSWKEIAGYLERGATTVQRWEAEEGLPVHRLPDKRPCSVFGYRSELDHWTAEPARSAETPGGRLAFVWKGDDGQADLYCLESPIRRPQNG